MRKAFWVRFTLERYFRCLRSNSHHHHHYPAFTSSLRSADSQHLVCPVQRWLRQRLRHAAVNGWFRSTAVGVQRCHMSRDWCEPFRTCIAAIRCTALIPSRAKSVQTWCFGATTVFRLASPSPFVVHHRVQRQCGCSSTCLERSSGYRTKSSISTGIWMYPQIPFIRPLLPFL